MRCIALALILISQSVFAQNALTSTDLAKTVPIADTHMHVTTSAGTGFLVSEVLDGMNQSNVKWGGGVGKYFAELHEILGDRYIPAYGQNEFFNVLYEKRESGLTDLENFSQMFTEADELFRKGKIKGFGEIHTTNVSSADKGINKRDIRSKSPVVEKMFEIANRYDGFVAIHTEYSKQAMQDFLELTKDYPKATLVLDHCVFYAGVEDIRNLMRQASNVVCEISSNGSIQPGQKAAGMVRIHGGFGNGALRENWLQLIEEFPDRFMLGTDTCCGLGRRYPDIITNLRNEVLAPLKPDTLEKVAYKNAIRVFHLKE